MTMTPPVAPDRALAPSLHPDMPPPLPSDCADSFSHSNQSPDYQEPSSASLDIPMTDYLANLPVANISPSRDDSEDEENAANDDVTVLSDPVVNLKEYSIKSYFCLSNQTASNPMPLFRNLATEMMTHDPFLKINVYDHNDASELWPLASVDDLPTADDVAQRYFVNMQINQQRTTASVIFRVISQYSHVKWRRIMQTYMSTHRISLKQHKLDALETTCIGFLAHKHPHYTHLNHFETYLRATLPDTTPQFHLRHLKPRIPAGFADAVQTDVIAIQTSREHAPRLTDIFTNAFPLNTDDHEFFISFRAGLDDDKLRSLYRLQNKWLAQVKIICIGSAHDIDTKVDVGLSHPVSLREFIREKPKEPSHINLAMDVENGGRNGKPVLIILPKHMLAAEAIYEDFCQSAHQSLSTSTQPVNQDLSSPTRSSRDPAYDAKMADFLAKMLLSNSDTDGNVSTSSTPHSQQYLKPPPPPHPTHGTNRPTMKSSNHRQSGRSYAAAATGYFPDSDPPMQPQRPASATSPQPRSHVNLPHQPPPIIQAEPAASSVSTMTNPQQTAILLEMHSMLKEQRQEIKKLKKRHELSKCTTVNLQTRIDSICNSLDELSRGTMDSDLSSADISSALSMASSQARSDDSSDSLDSHHEPDQAQLPSQPSSLRFTKATSRIFGVDDPPAEIRARRLSNDAHNLQPTSRINLLSTPQLSPEWLSPKNKKSHNSSFTLATTTPRPPVSVNPFSPLDDDFPHTTASTLLSSLGRTRSPSKKPASKKFRSSSAFTSDTSVPTHDVTTPASPSSPPHSSLAPSSDQDMTWDQETESTPIHDDLSMNESVDDSL